MSALKIFPTIFSALAAIAASAAAAEFETDLEGTWRGSLQKIDPLLHSGALPDITEHPEFLEFAIEFSDNAVRVYSLEDGAWQEVKPGTFGVVKHKTNAIVAAIDSDFSANGQYGWVETWNLTLTEKDADTLYVYWVRAVNNPHMPADSGPDARFFMSRFGTLERSDPVTGANAIHVSTAAPDSECRQSDLVCGPLGQDVDEEAKAGSKIKRPQ